MKFKKYLNEENLFEGDGKTVMAKKNKAGTIYALIKLNKPMKFDKEKMTHVPVDGDKYVVWIQKQNYKLGKTMKSMAFVTPGKMSFQQGQAYAKSGIDYEDALALFNKKLKGKTK